MIRATSQQFRFTIPYDISEVDTASIMFWQEADNNATEEIFIEKTFEDCEVLDSNILSVTLHAEETAQFSTDRKAYVQLKAITNDGFTFGSRTKQLTVYPMKEKSASV